MYERNPLVWMTGIQGTWAAQRKTVKACVCAIGPENETPCRKSVDSWQDKVCCRQVALLACAARECNAHAF